MRHAKKYLSRAVDRLNTGVTMIDEMEMISKKFVVNKLVDIYNIPPSAEIAKNNSIDELIEEIKRWPVTGVKLHEV
jgi:hypothetical protein